MERSVEAWKRVGPQKETTRPAKDGLANGKASRCVGFPIWSLKARILGLEGSDDAWARERKIETFRRQVKAHETSYEGDFTMKKKKKRLAKV